MDIIMTINSEFYILRNILFCQILVNSRNISNNLINAVSYLKFKMYKEFESNYNTQYQLLSLYSKNTNSVLKKASICRFTRLKHNWIRQFTMIIISAQFMRIKRANDTRRGRNCIQNGTFSIIAQANSDNLPHTHICMLVQISYMGFPVCVHIVSGFAGK